LMRLESIDWTLMMGAGVWAVTDMLLLKYKRFLFKIRKFLTIDSQVKVCCVVCFGLIGSNMLLYSNLN
jgi:hypothetical protein